MTEHVIVLHGLWMRSFTLAALRRRLRHAGYNVELLDYASVFREPKIGIEALLARTRALRNQKVHFVGHSLGGLIVLHALRQEPDLAGGNVVCLGAPLRGSSVARGVARFPGGSLVIGKSLEVLRNGIARWEGRQAVGAIAGSLPIGFGVAVGSLSPPHDGTVSVAETELPGLTDHVVVPATHTGLLFSHEAADQTIAFLRAARFSRAH